MMMKEVTPINRKAKSANTANADNCDNRKEFWAFGFWR